MIKPWLAVAILVPFTVFSTWATLTAPEGYWGFFTMPWTHPIWSQEFVDLCVALTLVTSWMVKDARARGVAIWPYLVATPFLGSVSPLVYLMLRKPAPPQAPAAT